MTLLNVALQNNFAKITTTNQVSREKSPFPAKIMCKNGTGKKNNFEAKQSDSLIKVTAIFRDFLQIPTQKHFSLLLNAARNSAQGNL